MGIFIVALIITLVDHTLLNGGIGYVALCAGVFTLMIFIALKADGRGYSITKMNNQIEMEKIEKALAEQAEREKAEAEKGKAESEEAEDGSGSPAEPNENAQSAPTGADGKPDGEKNA